MIAIDQKATGRESMDRAMTKWMRGKAQADRSQDSIMGNAAQCGPMR